ncbi:hypothetical protein T4D_585 [Trichinella pseudospiralis]|uniref:Uncharacterized protein n=1 Tax=Trichinella pseudospiralis TaxID=6337 RepID=A0A0V1FKR8_TRIPS|nr:hypothetical protein T4D_585 [Trichinella pseudospiralis]
MNSVPNALEESFYEVSLGVTAPRKYLVFVDNETTDSETEKFDAERPKLTEAQLEAGVNSQEETAQDGTNSEAYSKLIEKLYSRFILCVVCFFLLGFTTALWVMSLSLC